MVKNKLLNKLLDDPGQLMFYTIGLIALLLIIIFIVQQYKIVELINELHQ